LARTLRVGPLRRILNALVRVPIRLGIGDRRLYVLGVRGRRSGRLYTNPVRLVEQDGARWLVAPYGEVGWVANARAAGEVTLTRRGRTERVRIAELSPQEAAPVLRTYLREVWVVRPYVDAGPDSSPEELAAESRSHPVFRLLDG
jgi:deazaflavin-dependent oxidoreductase (nitroreductase family)